VDVPTVDFGSDEDFERPVDLRAKIPSNPEYISIRALPINPDCAVEIQGERLFFCRICKVQFSKCWLFFFFCSGQSIDPTTHRSQMIPFVPNMRVSINVVAPDKRIKKYSLTFEESISELVYLKVTTLSPSRFLCLLLFFFFFCPLELNFDFAILIEVFFFFCSLWRVVSEQFGQKECIGHCNRL
jgi:hypothetical protein